MQSSLPSMPPRRPLSRPKATMKHSEPAQECLGRSSPQPLHHHRSSERLHASVWPFAYTVPRDGFGRPYPRREEGKLVINDHPASEADHTAASTGAHTARPQGDARRASPQGGGREAGAPPQIPPVSTASHPSHPFSRQRKNIPHNRVLNIVPEKPNQFNP